MYVFMCVCVDSMYRVTEIALSALLRVRVRVCISYMCVRECVYACMYACMYVTTRTWCTVSVELLLIINNKKCAGVYLSECIYTYIHKVMR